MNQGLEQAFPQCVHKYPKLCTGIWRDKRNTDIEAMPEALHKVNGAHSHEDQCKKQKRTRVEAVLINEREAARRNRSQTETERGRAKAMSARKVEIKKSDGLKITDTRSLYKLTHKAKAGQCPPNKDWLPPGTWL